MEKGANGAAAAVAERDMPLTVSVEEYRRLIRAWYKLDGLKAMYDLGPEQFYRLAGKIMEIEPFEVIEYISDTH